MNQRFTAALGSLLDAARRAGTVRPDLDLEGVRTLFTGCAMQRLQDDPRVLAPMTALVIQALRSDPTVTDSRPVPRNSYGTFGLAENRNAVRVCDSCGSPIIHEGPGDRRSSADRPAANARTSAAPRLERGGGHVDLIRTYSCVQAICDRFAPMHARGP